MPVIVSWINYSKIKASLLVLLMLASLRAHQGCIHDQIIHHQKLIAINDTITNGRRLQTSTSEYGPIRFHIIYDTISVDSSTSMGQSIIKMMDIIQMFWRNTIEVYYAPSLSFNVASGIDSSYVQCFSFTVPQSVIKTPVLNADYGFFVEAKDDGDSGVAAYSSPCAYSMQAKQPLWGLLHWNTKYLTYDLLSFQMNIKVGIHESTHLLGFSSILYSNYVYGKYITNNQGSFINGSFIQKALRDQYGCVDSPGMPL